jgi:hypothetical protein
VGLDRIGDGEAAAFRDREVRGRVAPGIDHESSAVAEIDQVGGVAEALVDQGDDVVADGSHRAASGTLMAIASVMRLALC